MVEEKATAQSKLIPVLRDGVDVVKIIVFKELRDHFTGKYPGRDADYAGKLGGAVLNTLFGTPNDQPPFTGFVEENRDEIETAMASIAGNFEHLKIPMTDALRVQFLCDSLEGIDSEKILETALSLGILIEDRPVPLPKTFMQLARKLGVAYEILDPASTPPEAE